MPTASRRSQAFAVGAGQAPEPPHYQCAECGYESDSRKNFRRSENGHVCSTGHYEDREGNLKRQKNLYARR
jgi:hypothetical protein